MFTLRFTTTPVYIIDNIDEDSISSAREGCLIYNDGNSIFSLNFIERDGVYAYTEFFEEGVWPDKYYNDEDSDEEDNDDSEENYELKLSDMYQGIRLKMVEGEWYRNFSDLIKAIPDHKMMKMIDLVDKVDTDKIECEVVDSDKCYDWNFTIRSFLNERWRKNECEND
jgi:hypothetical protein